MVILSGTKDRANDRSIAFDFLPLADLSSHRSPHTVTRRGHFHRILLVESGYICTDRSIDRYGSIFLFSSLDNPGNRSSGIGDGKAENHRIGHGESE